MRHGDGARAEEQVAIIDSAGTVVGSAARSVMRRENLAHIVVSVLVRNSAGAVYVHRRTDTKDVFPGLHDCWVSGCLTAGEQPAAAAARELGEELGIYETELVPLFTQWYADDSTRHMCHAYTTTYDGPLQHQESEIAWGAWMTPEELAARLSDASWPFVPDGRAAVERWLADR